MKGISWGHRETRCQAEGTGGWGHADPVSELASENRWRHGPCPCPQNGLHALAEQRPQPGMLLPASQRLLVPAPPAKDSRCVRREGSGPNARGPWRPGQCWPVPGAEGQGGTRRPPPQRNHPEAGDPRLSTFPSENAGWGWASEACPWRRRGFTAPGPHCLCWDHARLSSKSRRDRAPSSKSAQARWCSVIPGTPERATCTSQRP